ncbi:hypothetical protein VKT23_018105 [Stygiomarasmius scandens]|uniref:F-box domain-containing protein n=1 Tax=Marasmiellus scandens TaxID=2682957 RepID=A0ABR1IU20_9AGAR
MANLAITTSVPQTIHETKPAESVFAVNEILEQIFQNCDKSSLKNCVVVGKRWSEVALDVLWYEVTDMDTLLAPLGQIISRSRTVSERGPNGWPSRSVSEMIYEFSPPPTHQNWLRFHHHYAPRVRILRLEDHSGDIKVPKLVNLLRHIRTCGPILPKLRAIHWIGLSSLGLAEPLFTFAHEGIQELTVEDTEDYCTANSVFCEAIQTYMPHLINLSLDLQPALEYIQPVCNVVKGLSNLQSVTIPSFSDASDAISALSHLKGLKKLHLTQSNAVTELHDHVDPPRVYFPALESLDISYDYQTASRFFCSKIPHLRSIHVSTSVGEQPSHVQILLSSISRACPCVAQALRPILQVPSISTFEIEHPFPADFGLEDVTEIATAWPNLKSLKLCCDPFVSQQPTSKQLDLRAILPFAQHCPQIEQLGLLINAKSSSMPSNAEIDALPSLFKKLQIFSVGISEIQHEGAVAQWLSLVCTPGCVIQCGPRWYEPGEEELELVTRWKRVGELLPHLLATRVWYEQKVIALEHKLSELGSN